MLNLLISPGRYISGYDNIHELGREVKKIGDTVLVLLDENILDKIQGVLSSLAENVHIEQTYFNGECCHSEIDRIAELLKSKNIDVIVGIGGGKLMDTTKAAGYKGGSKIVTVPTIAATCAAWSSHSAVYTEQGIAYEYYDIHKNPDMLFMDKKIISSAPVRYLISGMVDSLAKWVETKAFTDGITEKNVELEIAMYIAKKIYDEIFEFGVKAVSDIKNGIYSKEVDCMIEHTILSAGLVGGVGGEACRAVAAHAVNNAFTVLFGRNRENLHGEVVGFGNLVQKVLDGDRNEAEKLAKLYAELGAPVNLCDLNMGELDEVEFTKIVNRALYKGDTMWNLPYDVNFDMVKKAILEAEKIASDL